MLKFCLFRTLFYVVPRRRSGPPCGAVSAQLLSGGGVFLPFGGVAYGLLRNRRFLRRSERGARRFQDRFCVPVHKGGEQALNFRRHIVCKLPSIHIWSVSGSLKADGRAGDSTGRMAGHRGDSGVGRRAPAGGLIRSNCPRRWSGQGGTLRGHCPCTREGRRPDRPKRRGESEER